MQHMLAELPVTNASSTFRFYGSFESKLEFKIDLNNFFREGFTDKTCLSVGTFC